MKSESLDIALSIAFQCFFFRFRSRLFMNESEIWVFAIGIEFQFYLQGDRVFVAFYLLYVFIPNSFDYYYHYKCLLVCRVFFGTLPFRTQIRGHMIARFILNYS